MVKHDLTVRVARECAIGPRSDRALRNFSLRLNALARRVTRTTQRSAFYGGLSQVIHRIFRAIAKKASIAFVMRLLIVVELVCKSAIEEWCSATVRKSVSLASPGR